MRQVAIAMLAAALVAQPVTAAGPSRPPLSTELKQRIIERLRVNYGVPSSLTIALSPLGPSPVPGYDGFRATFSNGDGSVSHEFMISRDRKTLAHLEKMDLTKPPPAEAANEPTAQPK